MLTPEMQMKVIEWRRKVKDGTITLDEMKEAIKLLRENRVTVGVAPKKSRSTKVKPESIDSDALLNELGGL